MGLRLTSITLRGFKTVRNLADFEPGDLTIMIGPNGAGKSNFISFFRLLSWALAPPGQLQVHVAQQGGANALLHDGASVTTQIEAVLSLATDAVTDEWFQYQPYGAHRRPRNLGAGHRESQLFGRPGTANVILGMLRRIIVHQFHNTSQTSRI